MEIENSEIEVLSSGIDVVGNDSCVEVTVEEADYAVTVNKKEYVITGDSLYIPTRYEDAPQWLRDIIATITDTVFTQKITELNGLTSTLNGLIDELNVAKNTYTNSIISSADIDERINARIETLNSAVAQSDATLVNLISTKATPTEASALSTEILRTSINGTANGTIGALVGNLQTAITNVNNSLSSSINIVHAEMVGDSALTAEAITAINATTSNHEGRIAANASSITTLNTQVAAVDGKIATAKSDVTNTLNTTIVNGDTNVESKWGYNSDITIGGVSYGSGFGLATSVNSPGHGIATGQSEFWIKADKFKMTTTGYNGTVYSPFSVNGSNGEISFNGKVAFSNVIGYTAPDISGTITTNNNTFAQAQGFASYADMQSKYSALGKTIVSGGYVNTGLVNANSIVANSISADRFMAGTNNATVWQNGGLVSQNFNGNPYGNIGNPTAGFRLSSAAAGTSSDPNIYGAYLKGSTLSASVLAIDSLKIETSPGIYGPFVFTSATSVQGLTSQDYSLYLDTIYSPVYSSGYNPKRLSSFITPVNLTMNCSIDVSDVTCILEVSYNGGAWTGVDSRVHNGNGNSSFGWNPTFVASSSGWNYFQLRFRFSGQWLRTASISYLVINGS